ncbi:MAG TPA: hypothetical protein VK177_14950 [Flavobacteriales bacterium]|nr:hypothetical protein [Flavobacteriales bacterium]
MRPSTLLILFVGALALSFIAAGGELSTELIKWTPGKKLTWNDFQGKPDFKSKNTKAVTWTKLKGRSKIHEDRIEYDYSCFFNKEKSWHTGTSVHLLNHEQGHFDIGEICARKFRKALAEHISANISSTKKFLDSLENAIDETEQELTDLYERETDSSRNIQGQLTWDRKINTWLEESKSHTSTLVVIKREIKK